MSERGKKSNPKQYLMNYLINTGKIPFKEDFIVGDPDINSFEKIKQEFALHSEDAKQVIELFSQIYFESETVKKFREDLKKDFNEQQLREILEKSNKTINIFEKLVIELKEFNENFETIKEFNEKFKEFTQMDSKKEEIDKNIFDIDIPDDFWNDILLEKDIDDDDY